MAAPGVLGTVMAAPGVSVTIMVVPGVLGIIMVAPVYYKLPSWQHHMYY